MLSGSQRGELASRSSESLLLLLLLTAICGCDACVWWRGKVRSWPSMARALSSMHRKTKSSKCVADFIVFESLSVVVVVVDCVCCVSLYKE